MVGSVVLVAWATAGACGVEPRLGAAEQRLDSESLWVERDKLAASDAAANDLFGHSVSVHGDRLLIGAVNDDDGGSNSGAAYVFSWDGSSWIEEAKLTASDAAPNDELGTSVSLYGDRALVGVFRDDDGGVDSGSAYVFSWDGSSWIEEAKLTASDAAAFDGFGHAVSLHGDRALVGAYRDDDGGVDSGSVYVFSWDGAIWTEEAKLTASDAGPNDEFGYSVSLSGEHALIGARRDAVGGTDSGSAYVFTSDGSSFIEAAKLSPSDAAANDWFGFSVSIWGGRALVGAHRDDDDGTDSGSAYVFGWDGSSWTEVAKLTASDAAAGDAFGHSVSLWEDRALVGAHGNDDDGSNTGSAYVFGWDGSSFIELDKLTASDAAEGDVFGFRVSLWGERAVSSAVNDDDFGSNSGSVYVFVRALRDGQPCRGEEDCATGHCVDGVCCATACGGGVTTDCVACSVAAGSTTDGSCEPVADGASCDDLDACTGTDSCDAGACVGADPVVCTALDDCHDVGTCDPETGVCSHPHLPDGAPCDDGDGCTQTDACDDGVCVGADPVVCAALDDCHLPGTCNGETGLCNHPHEADGASCDDGDACTQTDTCHDGTCVGANPVVCAALDVCHVPGVCEPQTGVCELAFEVDGAPCDDGHGTCQGGTCEPLGAGGAGGGGDTGGAGGAGVGGASTGGMGGDGAAVAGAAGSPSEGEATEGDCSCRVTGAHRGVTQGWLGWLGFSLLGLRRRAVRWRPRDHTSSGTRAAA